jgi:alpha-tubulin suppressor-like RCC1 family protein
MPCDKKISFAEPCAAQMASFTTGPLAEDQANDLVSLALLPRVLQVHCALWLDYAAFAALDSSCRTMRGVVAEAVPKQTTEAFNVPVPTRRLRTTKTKARLERTTTTTTTMRVMSTLAPESWASVARFTQLLYRSQPAAVSLHHWGRTLVGTPLTCDGDAESHGEGGSEDGEWGENDGQDQPSDYVIAVDERGSVHSKGGCSWEGGTVQFSEALASLSRFHVVAVAAGNEHIAIATRSGIALSFGNGAGGRLGHGDEDARTLPTEIDALSGKHVTRVAAGFDHSVVACDNGTIFTFGIGMNGALGHGDVVQRLVPTAVDALHGVSVVQIAAGYAISAAISSDGRAFIMGGDRQIDRPQLVEALSDVAVVAIAADSNSCHLAAITSEGKLFTWNATRDSDWNPEPLGHGHVTDKLGEQTAIALGEVPTEVVQLRDLRVVRVSVGMWHTAAMTDSGRLFTFGSNSGALGDGTPKDSDLPQEIIGCLFGRPLDHNAALTCGQKHTCLVSTTSIESAPVSFQLTGALAASHTERFGTWPVVLEFNTR